MEFIHQTDRMGALREVAGAMSYNLRNLLQILVGSARLGDHEPGIGKHLGSEIQPGPDPGEPGVRPRDLQVVEAILLAGKRQKSVKRGHIFDLSRAVEKAIEVGMAWLEGDPEKEKVKINLKSSSQDGLPGKGGGERASGGRFQFTLQCRRMPSPVEGKSLLATWAEDGNVHLTVSDNGVGIPKENLDKVFQPFWTTKGVLATGLGLASSFGIVAHHGGGITVESEEGKGTSFLVTLPLAERAHARTEVDKNQRLDFNYRILVVDDLKPLLRILSHGLIRRGQTVFAASSGDDGSGYLRSQPGRCGSLRPCHA